MSNSNDIVPIGKYKGQPIERLMGDQPYSEWLLAQAWFVERYAELAQLLRMGRLTEPQDTPEHNAMVAGLIDQRDAMECLAESLHRRWSENIEDLYCSPMGQEIEPKGSDVRVSFFGLHLMIEAKPLIGDDYPSVIRQVKAGLAGEGATVTRGIVIARRVEPTNLTVDQVRRQFELSGVRLVLESEFFEAGKEWGPKRSAYVAETIAALEFETEALREDLSKISAELELDAPYTVKWERKHEADRLAIRVASNEGRLERLREIGDRS
jgi:hypothetical protein